jgi:hypothetical protein
MIPGETRIHLSRGLSLRKRRTLNFLLLGFLAIAFAVGCQKKQSENDAIREAVRQHLISLRTLNLQAMDMDFSNISIQEDHASAQVSFRLKNASPSGPAMQVAYQLQKQNGMWSVLKTAGVGGMIDHPAPGSNTSMQNPPGESHGGLPNFKDLVATPNAGGAAALPPGHPAIPQATTSPPK